MSDTVTWKEQPSPMALAEEIAPLTDVALETVEHVIAKVLSLGYRIERDIQVPADVAASIEKSLANPESYVRRGRPSR